MPTYQYQCADCGEALEIQQSFSDDALTVCPSCGGALRKLFNAVGVVFKGSGFYKTDHGSSKKASEPSSAPAGGKPVDSQSKSESKPA